VTGTLVDYSIDPFNHKIHGHSHKNYRNAKLARASIYYISVYDKYIDLIEEIESSSLDPYITFRSLYVQQREAHKNK
jgi:ABC-type transporter lipoprotein component MlaA